MGVDFDPAPATVQLWRIEYFAPCRARNCRSKKATIVARKLDRSGRFVRQLELCEVHALIVARRERAKGLEIVDRRAGWS